MKMRSGKRSSLPYYRRLQPTKRGSTASCAIEDWAQSLLIMLAVAAQLSVASESQANMIGKVGEYHLGQEIRTAPDLIELQPEEYEILRSFPGWFDMPGERVFKAPKVTLNGNVWDLTIGALDGKIYTLGLQDFGTDQAAADTLVKKTVAFITGQMGVPTEETKTPKRYIWEVPSGNVVLAERGALGFWSVNFLLTAARQKGFPEASSAVKRGALVDMDAQNRMVTPHARDGAELDEVAQAMIKQLREETKARPEDAEAWGALGAAYGKLHRYDEAVTALKRAIAINPKYIDAYLALASTYGFLDRPQEQIATCKEAIRLDPRNAKAHGTLGAAYLTTRQFKESIDSEKEALRIQPNFPEAHFALGAACLFSGDTVAAVEEAEALEGLDPQRAANLRDIIEKYKNARE
jgi:Flp pilus assembly protein TadD